MFFVCQRAERDAVLKQNMEFSQSITRYQKTLREGAEQIRAAEEEARVLKVDVRELIFCPTLFHLSHFAHFRSPVPLLALFCCTVCLMFAQGLT